MSLLADSLRHQLIPWSQHEQERFVVARSKMSAAQMPDGVTLTRQKIVGQRVIVKNHRLYGNVRHLIAQWPEAKMQEAGHYKLICVLAGRIDFHVGQYGVQCGEGFYLLLPPGLPRTGEPCNAPGYLCKILHVILYPHAVQCFFSHYVEAHEEGEPHENYLFTSARAVEIFRMLVEELIEDREDSARISNNLLSAFWIALQRELREGHYTTPSPANRPEILQVDRNATPDFKTELLNYVQTHLSQNLTLEHASRSMFFSRAQFVRRVRQETGKSFVQFLTDYRIEEAKVLLRDSKWTVTAIAEFLGFTTSSYFQLVFKRKTGKTPTQYRNSKK